MTQGIVQRDRIEVRLLEQEMRDSFIDYSMSVIVQRALPDARDGLKPVHRRILFAMREEGLRPNGPHKKSATVVGDVLGRYHPHGDSAVYDTMVRMVQEFSLRYPLINGQGNFGSIDGDSAAAYRYTEVKMTPLAVDLLADIDHDTVDMKPNFDGRLSEPEVLPCRLPHLLLNGSDGIAVGMATKIPPHNAGELLRTVDHLVANPDCGVEDLLPLLPGPDFPTGGYIWGRGGIESAYRTGRGRLDMRARIHLEEGRRGKSSLVVTELPYQVNKTRVIEQITRIAKAGQADAISDLRDESDRDGIRLVIELKRDAKPEKVVATLFKKTQLRYTFGVITLALVDGRPEELDLKQALQTWVDHRLVVIRRRAAHDLGQAEDRAHIVDGLLIALADIDRVIEIIRGSRNPESAQKKLRKEFKLSERQADAILAMRLAQLTGLEGAKLQEELDKLQKVIAKLAKLVQNDAVRRTFLREEIQELIAQYADPRRTEILDDDATFKLTRGSGGQAQLVLVSRQGYVKAQAAASGGGLTGAEAFLAREADFAREAFLCRASSALLVVTAHGNAHVLPVKSLPHATRSSRGKRLDEFIELAIGDEIICVTPVEEFSDDRFLVVATRQGQIKRSPLSDYENARVAGIKAAGIARGDEVVAAFVADETVDLVFATRAGQSIRFPVDAVRPMGRAARGVKGIDLAKGDVVVAVLSPRADSDLLIATAGGYAKRVPCTEFKIQGRAGKGLAILPERAKSGDVIGLLEVHGADRLAWELSDGSLELTSADTVVTRARREASRPAVKLEAGVSVEGIHPVQASAKEPMNLPANRTGEGELVPDATELDPGPTEVDPDTTGASPLETPPQAELEFDG